MVFTDSVKDALYTVIDWIYNLLYEFFSFGGGLNLLLPLFAVGVAVSVLMFAVKAIKSFIWGA